MRKPRDFVTISVIILAQLLAVAGTKVARGDTIATDCQRSAGRLSCVTTLIPSMSNSARTIPVRRDFLSADEVAAKAERVRVWEVFCKPVAAVDSLGVSRYTYAHPGCEHGRTQ